MSLIDIMDPDDGGPFHLTYQVSAVGRDAANEVAKAECRADGFRIVTGGRVVSLGEHRTMEMTDGLEDWHVVLVARPKA